MSLIRRHLSFANVASLLALVFSMSGGALAARHFLHPKIHYTITSTSQISPKVLRKLKGATGEIGPIGPQGQTGEPGPRGPSGGRGEPAPSELAHGASESGDFGLRGVGPLAESITFRIPLTATIAKAQVVFAKAGTPVENCPGPGAATRGYLCIYSAISSEVKEMKSFDAESGERPEGSGKLGFTLEVLGTGMASLADEGTYTVTEP